MNQRFVSVSMLLCVAACGSSSASEATDTAHTETSGAADSNGSTDTGRRPHTGSTAGSEATSSDPQGEGSTTDDSTTGPSRSTTTGRGSESGTTGGDTSGEGTSIGESSDSVTGSPPLILLASTSVATLHPGESVTFVVVATDPDGVDDLIGGALHTPDGAAYGALATTAEEGAYEVELTWDEINLVESIDIPPLMAAESRDFIAVVFDQGGEESQTVLTVALSGGVEGWAVCAGEPTDLVEDETCGSCGYSCLTDLGAGYGAGTCVDGGLECDAFWTFHLSSSTPNTTCPELCAAEGEPTAQSTVMLSCGISNGMACPIDNCNTITFEDLPAFCVSSAMTTIECSCAAVFPTPGWP